MSSAIQLLGAALIALSCVCSELTPALIGTASNSEFVNGTFQATASDEPQTQLLVSASQLLAALQSSNVSISAFSIIVDAPIDVDSVHSLSLYARTGSITISAALRTAGALTLVSGGGTEIAAPTTASSISVSTDLLRSSADTARGFTLSAPLRASTAGVQISLSEAVRVESSIVAATKIRLEVMGDQPVGLGNGSQQLQLTGTALQQMSAITLEVQAAGIFVDGVTAAQSAAINGVVSLVASGFGSRVVFDSEPSVFGALAAQADGGIEVNQNVSTSRGKLELDGNSNGAFFLLSVQSTAEQATLRQISSRMEEQQVLLAAAEADMRVQVTQDLAGYKRARATRAAVQGSLQQLAVQAADHSDGMHTVRADGYDHASAHDHRLNADGAAEMIQLEAKVSARRQQLLAANSELQQNTDRLNKAKLELTSAQAEKQTAAAQMQQLSDESNSTASNSTNSTIDTVAMADARIARAQREFTGAEQSTEASRRKARAASGVSKAEEQAVQKEYSLGVARRLDSRQQVWKQACRKHLWQRLRVEALTRNSASVPEGAVNGTVTNESSTVQQRLSDMMTQLQLPYSKLVAARQSCRVQRGLEYSNKTGEPADEALDLAAVDLEEQEAKAAVTHGIERAANVLFVQIEAKWEAETQYIEARKQMRQHQVNGMHVQDVLLPQMKSLLARAEQVQVKAAAKQQKFTEQCSDARTDVEAAAAAHSQLLLTEAADQLVVASSFEAFQQANGTATLAAVLVVHAEQAAKDASKTLVAKRKEANKIANTTAAAQVSVEAAIANKTASSALVVELDNFQKANESEYAARELWEATAAKFNLTSSQLKIDEKQVHLDASEVRLAKANRSLEAMTAQAVNFTGRQTALQEELGSYVQRIKESEAVMDQKHAVLESVHNQLEDAKLDGTMDLQPTVSVADGVHLSAHGALLLGQPTDAGVVVLRGSAQLVSREAIELRDDLVAVGGLPEGVSPMGGNLKCGSSPLAVMQSAGAITVLSGGTLRSPCTEVTWRVADVDLQGTVRLSTAQPLLIEAQKESAIIGLGNAVKEMHLSGDELQRMTARGGLVIYGTVGAEIFVDGVTAAQSAAINGVVSLVASGFGSRVVFDSEPSVFGALAAQSDGGIEVNQNVRTSRGKLELGRVEQQSDQKSSALAVIEAGVSLVAHNGLVIGAGSGDESEAGDWMTVSGATRLQSQAAAGIMLGASIKAAGLGGALTIDAGEGTLTIAKGRHVDSNGHSVQLSSLDLDLSGTLNAGQASVTVSGAKATQAISIGGDKAPQIRVVTRTAQSYLSKQIPIQMHLSDTELGKLSGSGGLTVGSNKTDIYVDHLNGESIEGNGMLTLRAKKVDFIDGKLTSAGDSVGSELPHGITIDADGAISMAHNVSLGEDTQLHSRGHLLLEPNVTLSAVNTSINISAGDMVLRGNLSTGAGAINIDCGQQGTIMAIGEEVTGKLHISGEEMQRIQTRSLTLGGWGCTHHVVNAMKEEYTSGIEGVVSLLAHRDDGKIVFGETMSWFPTLTAQADNGLFVHSDLKTYKGDLQLDADLNEDNCTDTKGEFAETNEEGVWRREGGVPGHVAGSVVCRSNSTKRRQHVVAFAGDLTIQAKLLLALGGVWQSPRQSWDEIGVRQKKKVTTDETLSVTTPIDLSVNEELTVDQQTTAPLKLMESEMPIPQSEDEAAEQAVEQALLAAELEEEAMEQSVVQQEVLESSTSDSERGPLTVAAQESSPPLDGSTSNVAQESEVTVGGETAAAEEASAVEEAVDVRAKSLALLSYRRFMRALFIQSPVRP